jgi:hypothetical protein
MRVLNGIELPSALAASYICSVRSSKLSTVTESNPRRCNSAVPSVNSLHLLFPSGAFALSRIREESLKWKVQTHNG